MPELNKTIRQALYDAVSLIESDGVERDPELAYVVTMIPNSWEVPDDGGRIDWIFFTNGTELPDRLTLGAWSIGHCACTRCVGGHGYLDFRHTDQKDDGWELRSMVAREGAMRGEAVTPKRGIGPTPATGSLRPAGGEP